MQKRGQNSYFVGARNFPHATNHGARVAAISKRPSRYFAFGAHGGAAQSTVDHGGARRGENNCRRAQRHLRARARRRAWFNHGRRGT